MTGWRRVRISCLLFVAVGASGGVAPAQEPTGEPRQVTSAAWKPDAPTQRLAKPEEHGSKQEHRFWDKTNAWLFAGVGASRTLDYFSTLNMRRRGRQEILLTDDVVDNHAAFAVIEAAGTGVSIGASYLFHRYGRHKLERWVSIVHISLATTGAVRNYGLKTFHATPASPAP